MYPLGSHLLGFALLAHDQHDHDPASITAKFRVYAVQHGSIILEIMSERNDTSWGNSGVSSSISEPVRMH